MSPDLFRHHVGEIREEIGGYERRDPLCGIAVRGISVVTRGNERRAVILASSSLAPLDEGLQPTFVEAHVFETDADPDSKEFRYDVYRAGLLNGRQEAEETHNDDRAAPDEGVEIRHDTAYIDLRLGGEADITPIELRLM